MARRAGFTLAEVMVAVGLLGITAAVSVVALNHMNNRAFLSRCQTGASTVAQNQIDLILSNQPFNPQKSQVPPELALATVSTGSSTNPTVPIYTDPRTGIVAVRGWMTSEVAQVTTSQGGVPLNVFRATVTVKYRFRKLDKEYTVVMNTMRCSDI